MERLDACFELFSSREISVEFFWKILLFFICLKNSLNLLVSNGMQTVFSERQKSTQEFKEMHDKDVRNSICNICI